MSDSGDQKPEGPDLSAGVPAESLREGTILLGRVGDDAVILARGDGGTARAIGATCTHYGGPLAEGIVVGDTVHCPWHHACFSLRTGEALLAPALDPVACYRVEERDGTLFVREPISPASEYQRPVDDSITRIVIIGAGAAGTAAAEMLRRCGYGGSITLIDQLDTAPVDRPNLSKDYLAGTAQEEWVYLRPPEFFTEQRIERIQDTRVIGIDAASHRIRTDGGHEIPFDRLLIATGATPNKLDVPGADLPTVHYLRTLDDSKAIIAAAAPNSHAVVIGASFIGLEVAASLRARKVNVTIVAPDQLPLERVLGPELGHMVLALHQEKGVVFRLGTTATNIARDTVTLSDGTALPADFVVIGVGVHPVVDLANDAGIKVDNGVVVDAQLQTSAPDIYAAGDIASWPDPRVGRIRVEHWVVAERQGQTAARNMLGAGEAFTLPPFFWSQHYNLKIDYVGHAKRDDIRAVSGDPMAHDCTVTYSDTSGALHAQADVGRDRASLQAEVRLDR
jgi:NADPH-dependent 2,4-dienoyl-CoA reductase/sulfur reductase-like enzyme/nitrite reductase/ring-hydroxylating ferredoxin subunit